MNRAFAYGLVLLTGTVSGPLQARAEGASFTGFTDFLLSGSGPSSANHSAQGYLGVDVRDVSDEQVSVLKLKDTRGAEITLVDHDAPAGTAGLREHDVVLQMNGQQVEGEDQIRRMLRDCTPGRTITLLISRDGQQMTKSAQMANREELERRAWEGHKTVPEPQDLPLSDAGSAAGYASTPTPSAALRGGNSFFGSILMNSTYTGAMLEQLSSQLAQFFGVPTGSGLLVRSVVSNSPAAQAGMHAGDVVVRANARAVTSTNDWTKAIKSSRGRPFTVTVLRDRKEETLTLTPDGKHRSSLEQTDTDGIVLAHLGFSWMPQS